MASFINRICSSRVVAAVVLGLLIFVSAGTWGAVSWLSRSVEPEKVSAEMAVLVRPVEEVAKAQALPTSILVVLPTVTPQVVAMANVALPTSTPQAVAMANVAQLPAVQAAPAQQLSNPALTKAQADAILVEVDAEVTIDDRTPGYRDVRFGVTCLGQQATGSVVFNINESDSWTGRLVCDDICNGFYLLRVSDGAVIPLTAQAYYQADFNYASLNVDQRRVAGEYGINLEKGEILAQHLFTTPVAVSKGDKLLVVGADDPREGVNRGFFFSWKFVKGQPVLVGPLNK